MLFSPVNDEYSKDADYIKDQAEGAFKELGVSENLEHMTYNGEHALTQERFDYIINWIVKVIDKI